MTRLNPYISFNGNTREAMEFYQTVLGGELRIDTFGAIRMEGMIEADRDLVMHAQLVTPEGLVLMAADTPTGMDYIPGARIAISLSGPDAEEPSLRKCWDKLTEGGTITMPLEQAPWGSLFGMLTDQYGIDWFVNVGDA